MWGASFLVIEERVVDIQDEQLLPLAAGVQHLHLIVSYLGKQVWLIDSWISEYLVHRGLNDLYRTKLSYGSMIRFHARHLPPSLVSKSSLFLSLPMCRRSSLLTERGGGVRGAKSYDRKKAWASINRSILRNPLWNRMNDMQYRTRFSIFCKNSSLFSMATSSSSISKSFTTCRNFFSMLTRK